MKLLELLIYRFSFLAIKFYRDMDADRLQASMTLTLCLVTNLVSILIVVKLIMSPAQAHTISDVVSQPMLVLMLLAILAVVYARFGSVESFAKYASVFGDASPQQKKMQTAIVIGYVLVTFSAPFVAWLLLR